MRVNKIKEKYDTCSKCSTCMNNYKIYGHGNINADIMVIGEGPGEMECETGIPFTGPAGQLLDKILAAIDLKREDLYYTNVVLCRTNEKNRTPSWSEIENCSERLNEEINEVKPNVILMIGSQSLKRFFGKNSKVTQCHGQWFMDLEPPYARYFSLYHPAWILNSNTEDEMKAKKKTMWTDVLVLAEDLEISNFTIIRSGS